MGKQGFILGFILLLIKNLNGKKKINAGAAFFLGPAGNDRNKIAILRSHEGLWEYTMWEIHIKGMLKEDV